MRGKKYGLHNLTTPTKPWYGQISQVPTQGIDDQMNRLIDDEETKTPPSYWMKTVWIVWDMPKSHKKKAKTPLGPWGEDATRQLLETMASRKAKDYLKVRYHLA